MTLLQRYKDEYVQITIDPRTLSKSFTRDGTFCFIGKLVDEDEHYVLLSPFDVYRPEDPVFRVSQEKVVAQLREQEMRQSRDVIKIDDRRVLDMDNLETRAEAIGQKVRGTLEESMYERLIPHSAIAGIDRC